MSLEPRLVLVVAVFPTACIHVRIQVGHTLVDIARVLVALLGCVEVRFLVLRRLRRGLPYLFEVLCLPF